jgi:glycosyltransferase involved in cell wall biosynthesis
MLISIITATYNSEETITDLIESLKKQSDLNFEWIICDGCSTDNTVQILERSHFPFTLKIDSRSDFGIYDALNRGIKISSGQYYLVVGSDDLLDIHAIANYRNAVSQSNADIILSGLRIDKYNYYPRRYRNRFLHQMTFVAGHSVGTLIRKELHYKIGFYSKKFPIAADHLFLECALVNNFQFLYCDFIAGKFGSQGISSSDKIGALVEAFRIQFSISKCKSCEIFIFILRLFWNYRSL